MVTLIHESLSEQIIAAAIAVHTGLGPGLLENIYESCLHHELTERGLDVARQVSIPVRYKGKSIECGYRADMMIGKQIVVEVKAVETIRPIHEAQLLTYLRLSGARVGLLFNFNVIQLIDGITRRVN